MRVSSIRARVVVKEAYESDADVPTVVLHGTNEVTGSEGPLTVVVSSKALDIDGVQIGSEYWASFRLQVGADKIEHQGLVDYAVHLPRCGKDPTNGGDRCTCGLNEWLGLSPTE